VIIRKAVIPAAGFGTRFLPATKSQPKEMLPIVDTPTIQYVVQEAVASGIRDILMVIGKGKRAIEEHFDRNFDLENELIAKEKHEALEAIRRISDMANIHFVWQKEMKGLGDAVLCARDHVGQEPFAVLLGDTILDGRKKPVTRQLMDVFDRYQESIVAVEEVERSKVSRYGVIKGSRLTDALYLVEDFVEKPAPHLAPSNLAIASRYILTPDIFGFLENTKRGKNNEIQLTDALRMQVKNRAAYALKFDGTRYDIGNKLDFIKTNVIFGLRHADMAKDLKVFLRQMAGTGGRRRAIR
jgi:UTP--glucose-1-phosphate uridylyltransferase